MRHKLDTKTISIDYNIALKIVRHHLKNDVPNLAEFTREYNKKKMRKNKLSYTTLNNLKNDNNLSDYPDIVRKLLVHFGYKVLKKMSITYYNLEVDKNDPRFTTQ